MTPSCGRWTSPRRCAQSSRPIRRPRPPSRSSPTPARRSSSSGSPAPSWRKLSAAGWHRRWRCFADRARAEASGGVALPQREGDPIVELPLFLECQDAQEQLFVDVLELATPLDPIRIERLWNERLELLGGIHC